MADNTIGKGPRSTIPGLPTSSEVQTQSPSVTQTGAPLRIDISELPRHADLSGQSSPLEGLVSQSLAKLGDSRYGGVAKNTMGLLISTLGASAARVKSAEIADEAVRELRATYASVLRGAVDVTPERLMMIKDDVPKLIKLAVSVMDDGKSSAKEIIDGARELGASFATLLAMPPAERKAAIEQRKADMNAERAMFAKGADALEAAKLNVLERIDAFSGILATLEKYVAFPQIPS